jgi:heme exporter protein B
MFSVSNLSCSRGDKRLFSGVSFTLEPGQWLHLEGDNGVGKTSLLRILCGLSALEEGEISWKNQSVAQNPDDFRQDLAYLGHQLALKEDLTPLENLRVSPGQDGFARQGAIACSGFVPRPKKAHCLGQTPEFARQIVDFGRALCGPRSGCTGSSVGCDQCPPAPPGHGIAHQPPSRGAGWRWKFVQADSMSAFVAIVKRDLTLALRRKNEVITAVFFFVVVAALFPLGIGPEMNTLRLVAPGILWVGALLASMLSLSRMFATDFADGTLEQMALSPNSLSLLVAAKILAHWLLSGLPLVLLAPILGLQFDLSTNALWVLTLSLLLGTPVLSLIGAVGAALTLGVRGGDVLLSLLVLPLYVPALVFGAGAVQAEISGLGASAHLSVLAALVLVAAVFSPWASAASLRIALES